MRRLNPLHVSISIFSALAITLLMFGGIWLYDHDPVALMYTGIVVGFFSVIFGLAVVIYDLIHR